MNRGKENFKLMTAIQKFKEIFFLLLCIAILPEAFAQKDTTKRAQTVEITSAYRPVLRNSVKINLSASPFAADTSRPRLAYNIPAQNLFFSYQPIPLKPLSLQQDTALDLGLRNFLKAGFGNLTTPYIKGSFSFGDGKTSLINLKADYISSKGPIAFQDFSEVSIKGIGSYFTKLNEVYGGVGISQHEYYQYGYDHALYINRSKESLRRRYQDIGINAGFKNTSVNSIDINYSPSITAHIFSRENAITESSLLANVPIEKKFSESVSFKLNASADVTSYTNKLNASTGKVINNLYQVAPELVYYSDKFTFHGGVSPTWDNGELSVLPNIYGEAQLQHNILMVQIGWVGRFTKNTFRTLSNENPYMQDPTGLLNTKEVEYYGGIKATVGKHFSFNAKVSYISLKNLPLFVNDTSDGKSFIIRNESQVSDLRFHGDMNLVSQDKFTLTAAADINTYTLFTDNNNAWHKIPIQLTGSFRWNAFKQVLLKADLFTFSNIPYILKNNVESKLPPGTDLSAGAEFKITQKFSAWLDLNNVLNSKYQRWNNYPVYGLNVIGGLIMRF